MAKLGLSFLLKEYTFLTRAEAKAIFEAVNQEQIFEDVKATFSYEIWDEVTPINGIAPETILNSADTPTHADRRIYLIYENGNLMILQKANPFSSGNQHMTAEDINTSIANQHIEMIADNKANIEIIKAIEAEIDKL